MRAIYFDLLFPKVLSKANKQYNLTLTAADVRFLFICYHFEIISYSSYIKYSRQLCAHFSDRMFVKSSNVLVDCAFIQRISDLPVKYRITPLGITFLKLLDDKLKVARF